MTVFFETLGRFGPGAMQFVCAMAHEAFPTGVLL